MASNSTNMIGSYHFPPVVPPASRIGDGVSRNTNDVPVDANVGVNDGVNVIVCVAVTTICVTNITGV